MSSDSLPEQSTNTAAPSSNRKRRMPRLPLFRFLLSNRFLNRCYRRLRNDKRPTATTGEFVKYFIGKYDRFYFTIVISIDLSFVSFTF